MPTRLTLRHGLNNSEQSFAREQLDHYNEQHVAPASRASQGRSGNGSCIVPVTGI